MCRQEKGITLVSLVVTVIVMFILLSVTIESGTELLRSSKFKTVETNMMLIQSRAEVLYEKFTFDETITFNSGKVIIKDYSTGTAEQQEMEKELKSRQVFMTNTTQNIENIPEALKTLNVASEISYYENARFKQGTDGKVHADENGKVETTSLFLGDENSQENWFLWDKNYVLSQVSDKIDINDNEYFLVNIYTHDVLYSAGFKDKDGNIYFLLSDMKNGVN